MEICSCWFFLFNYLFRAVGKITYIATNNIEVILRIIYFGWLCAAGCLLASKRYDAADDHDEASHILSIKIYSCEPNNEFLPYIHVCQQLHFFRFSDFLRKVELNGGRLKLIRRMLEQIIVTAKP
mmetsp:Transcript_436/g.761  ORF Transcript_436/g.761 Transcript_436/m.761 type:complete len:125 (-) Transcript_436:746-1120(-)